jgi:23S rRNA pseudouridine1911/1915/1917 synthase
METREFRAERREERLDRWLAGLCPDLSRVRIQALVKAGRVRLDGQPARDADTVRPGQVATLEIPDVVPARVEAEAIALEVLFEDKHLIAVNKPPGLVVHPAPGHAGGTLVNALLHHCRGQLSGIGGEERPGIVHRLDKDTSGVLLAAKSDPVHRALARAFHDRKVRKVYAALVAGVPRQREGLIDVPIARHSIQRQRMAVVRSGRPSMTRFQVERQWKHASLLACDLLTGRTHQIRVHLAHIGCPILGDAVYGRHGAAAPRQMLHARELEFQHPITGKTVRVCAPLAPDFEAVLKRLDDESR